MRKVKVLFFAADPLSSPPDGRDPRLRLDENVRQVRETVDAAPHRDALEVIDRWAVRTRDLVREMNRVHPQVVHFSGHGSSDGLVVVGSEGRGSHAVDAAGLTDLLRLFRDDIQLVVLSACFSRPQAEAVAEVVGCAIGTPATISDDAAITFDATFYGAIAFGRSVQFAFDQARAQLRLDRIDEQEYPQLIVRQDVDASRLVLIPPTDTDVGGPPLSLLTPPIQDSAPPQEAAWVVPPASDADVPRWRRLVPTRVGIASVACALTFSLTVTNVFGKDPVREPTVSDIACGAASPIVAGRAPGTGLPLAGSPTPSGPAQAATDLARAKAFYRAGEFGEAAALFQSAADDGNPEAMGCIGYMYLYGKGVKAQAAEGLRLLRKAASDERDAHSMYALAVAYLNGDSVDRAEHRAREWFGKAAREKNHAESMRSLGILDQEEENDSSYQAAREWYRKAVDAGSVSAMVDLGMMYEQGLGTAPDTAVALYWYQTAANVGLPRGMVALGRAYQNGIGVRQDYAVAMRWYLKAATVGSADAMNSIGVLHAQGLGVRRSRRKAIRWFERAADAGSSAAVSNLKALGRG
jgi:TPR repeat protein